MKKYIYLALFSLIVFSCKKQEQPDRNIGTTSNDSYTTNVKAYLKTNLADTDLVKVDFSNSILSKQGKDWYLRIALLDKNLSRDFVLLKTDTLGICSVGKFVHIRRDSSDMKTFNGKISTAGFDHAATIKKVDNNIASTLDCDEDEESVDRNAVLHGEDSDYASTLNIFLNLSALKEVLLAVQEYEGLYS